MDDCENSYGPHQYVVSKSAYPCLSQIYDQTWRQENHHWRKRARGFHLGFPSIKSG